MFVYSLASSLFALDNVCVENLATLNTAPSSNTAKVEGAWVWVVLTH